MSVLILLLLITAVCLFLGLRYKRSIFLTIPFLSIFVYFVVQIAMVPVPFMDTIKFIFSLN